ncbi:MAG: sigma 54-interacting transcriptional regulator [bacterium]
MYESPVNLTKENIYLKKEREQEYGLPNIIGKSKALQEVIKLVKKVAKTNANVLIYGESGTGKELVARAIHINSLRKDKPFIVVNCAAIPETLLESELFGYAPKSGISGADLKGKPGKFELADEGSIFLDEVADMTLSTQAKILRVLQEKEFERISDTKPIKVDVRIIAATNKNLEEAIKKKEFREDLYFRLNVISISLPPLCERKEDIPLLIEYFIERYAKETKKNVGRISDEALELLMQYDYPGNVRELENLIERAVILTEGDTILLSALPTDLSKRTKITIDAPKSTMLNSEIPYLH